MEQGQGQSSPISKATPDQGTKGPGPKRQTLQKGSRNGDWYANLPARVGWKTRDLHPVDRAARSRRRRTVSMTVVRILATRATSELDGQAFALELTAVWTITFWLSWDDQGNHIQKYVRKAS